MENTGVLNFPPGQNDELKSNKVPGPKPFYGSSTAEKKLRTEEGSTEVLLRFWMNSQSGI